MPLRLDDEKAKARGEAESKREHVLLLLPRLCNGYHTQGQSEMCVPLAPIPRNIRGLTTTVMAGPELMLLLGALISILSVFLVFLMLGLGFACYNLSGRHVSAARGVGRRSSPPQGISAFRGADTSGTTTFTGNVPVSETHLVSPRAGGHAPYAAQYRMTPPPPAGMDTDPSAPRLS